MRAGVPVGPVWVCSAAALRGTQNRKFASNYPEAELVRLCSFAGFKLKLAVFERQHRGKTPLGGMAYVLRRNCHGPVF